MAKKINEKEDFMYFHVRVDREHYELYKKICKENGDTVAGNMRRYIYAVCKQYEDLTEKGETDERQ